MDDTFKIVFVSMEVLSVFIFCDLPRDSKCNIAIMLTLAYTHGYFILC